MPLDGSSAVHQPVHRRQGGLLVLSSPRDLLGLPAEALPLDGTCDLLVEPFERVCDTAELSDQLRLAHLVQTNHRATKPTSTAGPAVFRGRLVPDDLPRTQIR